MESLRARPGYDCNHDAIVNFPNFQLVEINHWLFFAASELSMRFMAGRAGKKALAHRNIRYVAKKNLAFICKKIQATINKVP